MLYTSVSLNLFCVSCVCGAGVIEDKSDSSVTMRFIATQSYCDFARTSVCDNRTLGRWEESRRGRRMSPLGGWRDAADWWRRRRVVQYLRRRRRRRDERRRRRRLHDRRRRRLDRETERRRLRRRRRGGCSSSTQRFRPLRLRAAKRPSAPRCLLPLRLRLRLTAERRLRRRVFSSVSCNEQDTAGSPLHHPTTNSGRVV